MKKLTLLTLALALLVFNGAFAQTYGEIHGKLLDSSGEPIIGAVVTVTAGAALKGDQTDENGKFRIKPLSPGHYTLTAKATGKVPSQVEAITVDPDKITFVPTIVMVDSTYSTQVVEIVKYKDPLISSDGEIIHTIRAKEMKNLPAANGGSVKSIVASLTSDIKVSPDGQELYFRGSRAGSVIYFIDGVKIRENVPNVPSSGLSSISVYTGGVPAKYGDTTGGVVVIETKSYLEDYYEKMNEEREQERKAALLEAQKK